MTRVEMYEAFLADARRRGDALIAYDCPDCSEDLHSFVPTAAQEPFTALVECPYCEGQHFRLVRATGAVFLSTHRGDLPARVKSRVSLKPISAGGAS